MQGAIEIHPGHQPLTSRVLSRNGQGQRRTTAARRTMHLDQPRYGQPSDERVDGTDPTRGPARSNVHAFQLTNLLTQCFQ